MARRKRHQGLDRGFALAVDPVQVLQQQDGRARGDYPVDRVAYGVDDRAPPQQGFEIVPARIVDGLVEYRAERSWPKVGMRRRWTLGQLRLIRRRDIAHLQGALEQLLE